MRKRGHPLFAATYDAKMRKLERELLAERRARLLADLKGKVLEVGAGTGVNLSYYRQVEKVVLAEPDPAMLSRLAAKVSESTVDVELSDAVAESLPFADASFDAVVCTLVLCTVTDLHHAGAETHRVLKHRGKLIVIEHVRGTGRLAHWQDRLTPLWSRVQAGCHPNRDTQAAIEQAGFDFEHVAPFQPIPGWIPVSPMLEAVAVRS